MSEKRLYVYKIRVDGGGAPAVEESLLSLAICKPAIRRTAAKGDWIFAFGINSESPPNRLAYIAEVTEKLVDGSYYEIREYANRPDCIYERAENDELTLRSTARFHNEGDARDRDVGIFPDYKNANVVVSSNFRYFGGSGTDDWKKDFPQLKDLIENLGQGHRVNHYSDIHEELLALQKTTWQENDLMVLGRPLHAENELVSLDADDDSIEVTPKKCSYIRKRKC